jgi:hypothetical protein
VKVFSFGISFFDTDSLKLYGSHDRSNTRKAAKQNSPHATRLPESRDHWRNLVFAFESSHGQFQRLIEGGSVTRIMCPAMAIRTDSRRYHILLRVSGRLMSRLSISITGPIPFSTTAALSAMFLGSSLSLTPPRSAFSIAAIGHQSEHLHMPL